MNKIQLIDAETLYYKPLAHPRMLIDGILADGLAVMAGDSKIGKSWMVLWLCLQISKGEPVWGIPTRKTDVVYLALEDRESGGPGVAHPAADAGADRSAAGESAFRLLLRSAGL